MASETLQVTAPAPHWLGCVFVVCCVTITKIFKSYFPLFYGGKPQKRLSPKRDCVIHTSGTERSQKTPIKSPGTCFNLSRSWPCFEQEVWVETSQDPSDHHCGPKWTGMARNTEKQNQNLSDALLQSLLVSWIHWLRKNCAFLVS